MLEAKLIGFKEGLKVALVWIVFYSYLITNKKEDLMRPFKLGVVTAYLISVLSVVFSIIVLRRDLLGNLVEMSFAFFLLLSAASLFQASGVGLFGRGREILSGMPGTAAAFFFTIIFFIPDSIGALLLIKEMALMRGFGVLTYVYALLGFGLAVLIIYLILRFYRPYWIGAFFDLPQLLLFLAIVKLLGGGTEGTGFSLIPSVQQGLVKFMHDMVHQVLLLFLIPDHPLLKATTWDFIGFFFGSGLASAGSLIILLFFPLIFIYYRLFRPLPDPDIQKSVDRRKVKAAMLLERRKKALPVLVFIGLILAVWFSGRGETASRMYEPDPRPVAVVSGVVSIPLKDPSMNLMDGALHKFSLTHEGRLMRILAIRKPDNTLSVCLDACQICPPDGYGQRDDHVVCLYCNTPLSIASVGIPGGCNPIPLEFEVIGGRVKIELGEIINKWDLVDAGTDTE